MSVAAKVLAALLGLVVLGVVGFGLAVVNGWGPYAPEVAFGSDEVLTADASIVLDSTLALDGPAVEPCPAVSMPIPAKYSDAVKSSAPTADIPESVGQTSVRLSSTSWLLVVCLGDADKTGTPEQIVQHHRTDADFSGSFPVQLRPVHVTAPFGEAVRWSGSFAPDGTGKWLTDWYVEHDGTVLAVGYLREATDPDRTALVESMLAGLTWGS